MDNQLKVHLVALGLLGLLIGVILLFWSYPKLLIYLLLAIVAALAYGALYLILAAKMDPKPRPSTSGSTSASAEVESGQGSVVELRPRAGEPPARDIAADQTIIEDEDPTLVDPPKDTKPAKKTAAKKATAKKKKARKKTSKKAKRASGDDA